MSDNRTTELLQEIRSLLDGRGVDYNEYSRVNSHAFAIDYCDACGDYLSEIEVYGACICATKKYLTPEQAIAATLGRPKAKSHPYGYEPDTGAFDMTRCECGCLNDISAKYCNDCGGEIEIDESAEKEYYDGYSKHTVFAKKHDDGSLEFCERRYVPEESVAHGTLTADQVEKAIHDCSTYASYDGCTYYASGIRLQAIADELNARAERTCTVAASYDTADVDSRNSNAEWYFAFSCGCELYWDGPEPPNYCPNCGARIEVIE